MRITSGVVTGISRLARLQVELSGKARQKLKWFNYYNSRGHNARFTCRHFDISPQTFYRWKRRLQPQAYSQPVLSVWSYESLLVVKAVGYSTG